MNKVESIIDNIIGIEGGYSDNPLDRGGPTRWGVTQAVARRHGYKGDMKDYPRESAKEVFLADYFLAPNFDKVFAISEAIAAELTDTGINCGTGFAKPLLQDCLNLLNRDGKDYKELVVDGIIGHNTINALKTFLKLRGKVGEQVLLKMLNVMQCNRYIEICRKNPSQETFLFGWIYNRVEI